MAPSRVGLGKPSGCTVHSFDIPAPFFIRGAPNVFLISHLKEKHHRSFNLTIHKAYLFNFRKLSYIKKYKLGYVYSASDFPPIKRKFSLGYPVDRIATHRAIYKSVQNSLSIFEAAHSFFIMYVLVALWIQCLLCEMNIGVNTKCQID